MSYRRSAYRIDFETRIQYLKSESIKANKLSHTHHEIRDMVFQCAIFQTSAALESYIRLTIESWFQEIKARSLGASLPDNVRGHLAVRKLTKTFEKYVATRDEGAITSSLGSERALWSIMTGSATIPTYISGTDLHDGTAYPSYKNIHKLFLRLGINNVHDQVSAILKRDTETMIESFQSIRTALAHSSPPEITIADVKARLSDMSDLVRALDRVLHRLVNTHGGKHCWK